MRAMVCVAMVAALMVGCAEQADDPFCAMARCAELCVDALGCVERHAASDGAAHVFAGEQSLCGAVSRDDIVEGEAPRCARCAARVP